MTDLPADLSHLSHLSDEEFNALCPQGEHAPGPEPLSPGAQALLDAVFDHWPGGYNHPGKPLCVAAALRALADQVAPTEQNYEEAPHKLATVFLNGVAYAANEMRLIATELEAQ